MNTVRGGATYRFALGLLVVLATVVPHAWAEETAEARPVRARPPKFPQNVVELFSGDVRENLGPRPDPTTATAADSRAGTAAKGGPLTWSKLISAEGLEDEIKSIKPLLATDLKTPTAFKAGGFKKCRRNFSVLAICFAIGAEYDGQFRWKDQAATARDLFAQAALRCAQSSDAAYDEAKLRAQDLESLLRGNTLQATADPTAKTSWPKVSERPPLMSRMEQAQQQGLTVWTANAGEFTKNADKLRHEAMLLAALSEVITRPGFEYADDKEYVDYAKTLQKSSLDVIDALDAKNFEQARKAVGNATKSCSTCHGTYRG